MDNSKTDRSYERVLPDGGNSQGEMGSNVLVIKHHQSKCILRG
jgi:hypothetical protein